MKLFNFNKKKAALISDAGVKERTDVLSVVVILVSILLIIVLVTLGVLALTAA